MGVLSYGHFLCVNLCVNLGVNWVFNLGVNECVMLKLIEGHNVGMMFGD